jgi:KDO2-lipid IV(A) lauroyltransferase
MKPTFMHRLESIAARALFALLAALPLPWASNLGGFIGRQLLSRSHYSRRIRNNLALVMPELNARQVDEIVKGTWDNLCRTAFEFAHLGDFKPGTDKPGTVETTGMEHVEKVLAEHGQALFFSAHIGNWEAAPMSLSFAGIRSHSVYRTANNPIMDAVITKQRNVGHQSGIPKGRDGAREIIRILKSGDSVSMLVDQKMNEGMSVPFFGQPAMSPIGIVQIARRLKIPIIPAYCERLEGPRFRMNFSPALDISWSDDRDGDHLAAMTKINDEIESWIRRRPGQWLWLHQRWGKF